MTIENHYRTLGVHKLSTDAEVKAAYGRLARQYHPDHTGGDKAKSDLFCSMTAAYNVLKDKKQRKEYDVRVALLGNRCPTCQGAGVASKQKGYSKKVTIPCKVCAGTGCL